jgi:hypothetical protein
MPVDPSDELGGEGDLKLHSIDSPPEHADGTMPTKAQRRLFTVPGQAA